MKLIWFLVFVLSCALLNAQTLVMETGVVSTNHTVSSVVLNNTFVDPVVIARTASFNGSHQATVRLDNITGVGFDIYLEEPTGLDGPHTYETVHYVVIEKGKYTLGDGSMLEAGVVSSANLNFQTITLLQSYAAVPCIFTQVQTDQTSTRFLKTRQRNSSISSFELKLEREESLNTTAPSGSESIGYFAISRGGSVLDGVTAEANSFSVDEKVATRSFTETFSSGNHMVASIATFDGGDPANLRWTALSTAQVKLFVHEDISRDSERNHVFETVDYFVTDGGESGIFLSGVLPIELVQFSALPKSNYVQLNWRTASETNNDHFVVERSADVLNWEPFAQLDGAGNSTSEIHYSMIDHSPVKPVTYYRLKQVDYNGEFQYSYVLDATLELSEQLLVYPNPARDYMEIESSRSFEQGFEIRSINAADVTATVRIVRLDRYSLILDIGQLRPGTYFFRMGTAIQTFYKL